MVSNSRGYTEQYSSLPDSNLDIFVDKYFNTGYVDRLTKNQFVGQNSTYIKSIDRSLSSGHIDGWLVNQYVEQNLKINPLHTSTKFIKKPLTSTRYDSHLQDTWEREFSEQLLYEFKASIHTEELEFGFIGKTTKLIENYIKLNKDLTLNSLSKFGLDNFNNIKILYAILHTFAHLRYNLVEPIGPTFALATLNHKNIEIKDFSIQCFEIWNDKKTLSYLKVIKIEEEWLNHYFQSVITSIELS